MAYRSPPKMVVWITNLDVSNGANCLVRTRTLDVTIINFTLHSDIWGSTEAGNAGRHGSHAPTHCPALPPASSRPQISTCRPSKSTVKRSSSRRSSVLPT
ncbi:hypothetical protein BDV93DRAFT_523071 [Ceratobasidium sp. AG-I]|nr:hypothetical protein BDV93DRAFT_523071 [Ceratobasidium sp. AG-I]